MRLAMDKGASTSYFNESTLNKKLENLNQTADCIQTVSLWIIHHRAQHERIVKCWYDQIQSAPTPRRLSLFYLANDVIQNCVRKNAQIFHEQFREYVTKSIPFLRCQPIKREIERIFQIWKERQVYSQPIIDRWIEALNKDDQELEKIIAEYQPESLCQMLEASRLQSEQFAAKQAALASFDLEEPSDKFRERAKGALYQSEIRSVRMRCLCLAEMIRDQLKMRRKLIAMLEQACLFYEAQYSDAKVVVTAYKNFGTKVTDLKRKLDELKQLLPKKRTSKRRRSEQTDLNDLFSQAIQQFPGGPAVHQAMLVAYSSQIMPHQPAQQPIGFAGAPQMPHYFYQANADIDCRFSTDQLIPPSAKDPRQRNGHHRHK